MEKVSRYPPKQMSQRLPIALVQVKGGNTSETVLNHQLLVLSERNY